jgi:hypothetical protein
MDGTIANLYGVENWLAYLIAEDVKPYKEAEVMVNMNSLARILNRLQRNGHEIGVISWTAKNGSKRYNEAVESAKRDWLKKHLASVKFDFIAVVPYGYSKNNFANSENDILFDDEEQNRKAWSGVAYDVNNIIEVLKRI